jgi:hypothetical protein
MCSLAVDGLLLAEQGEHTVVIELGCPSQFNRNA